MAYTFNGITKIITFDVSTTEFDVRDLWSRYLDWLAISDNSKYLLAMRNVGGDPLPGSKELGLTYFMTNGWKIKPFEESQVLTVNGNLYSEDGSSPYAPVLGSFNVTIISSVSNLVDSTVQQLPEIEYASYNGGVTIDTVNGTDSSVYPYGTPLYPCKTTANSYAIRIARGFKKVYLRSDLNLIGIPDGVLRDLDIVGETGSRKHTLTISNVLVTDCKATNLTVTGAFKEGSTAQAIDCEIHDALNVNLRATNCSILSGIYESTDLSNCLLEGDIQIKEGGNMSGVGIVFEGDFTTIDMQNAISTVSLDVDSGYFKLINAVNGCLAEFNLRGGEIEIDPTCTGGEYYLEGYGTLYNEGVMTEKANHLLALETIPAPIWNELTSGHQITGTFGKTVAESSNKIKELHKIGGLDSTTPATTTQNRVTAGDIRIDISGNGETITTFTRND
jgi:hypothetical protein